MVAVHLSDIFSDGSTPQLSCLVGFVSLDSDRLYRWGVSSDKKKEGKGQDIVQDKLQWGRRHRADPEPGRQEDPQQGQPRDLATDQEQNKVGEIDI